MYKRDLEDLLFERVFDRIGIERSDLRWGDSNYRPHTLAGVPRREAGSGSTPTFARWLELNGFT